MVSQIHPVDFFHLEDQVFGELFRSIFGRKKSWIFATSLKELIPLVFLDLDFFRT